MLVQGDLLVGLGVHEVVQAAVLVQVLHLTALDEGGGELIAGVVALLGHGTGDHILGLGAHEGSALTGLNMLELHNLEHVAVLFKSYAIAKIACRNHK